MSNFKIGDAVRVKAGSPKWEPTHLSRCGYPKKISFGNRLLINKAIDEDNGSCVKTDYIYASYLEPWNDSEEWDGEKWVAVKALSRISELEAERDRAVDLLREAIPRIQSSCDCSPASGCYDAVLTRKCNNFLASIGGEGK